VFLKVKVHAAFVFPFFIPGLEALPPFMGSQALPGNQSIGGLGEFLRKSYLFTSPHNHSFPAYKEDKTLAQYLASAYPTQLNQPQYHALLNY
jgi:hypothetical protein